MENIDSNGTDDATLQDTVVPLDSMYTGYTDSFICQKWRISSSVVDTLLKIHQLYYIVPCIIILPIVLYCIYTFIWRFLQWTPIISAQPMLSAQLAIQSQSQKSVHHSFHHTATSLTNTVIHYF